MGRAEPSKNSMQDQISGCTHFVGIAIHHNYVIGCQTVACWMMLGFKKIHHSDDRPVVCLSVQIKTWCVIRWEANIDRLYYPPILFRNKAKHKLRYLTEIKMWENTRRSHKQVPNLSQIRVAICQRYQNISLSITQNICSTRSPDCESCDVLSPWVSAGDWHHGTVPTRCLVSWVSTVL